MKQHYIIFSLLEKFLFSSPNLVDSNDVLYGSDPKFLAEINKMCSVLLEEILNNLQILGESKEFDLQVGML